MVMLCGCTLGGGDGVDPPPDDPPDIVDGVLPPASSMFTGVYAVATDADAKVWVVVRGDATGDAVLVTQDVRFDGTEELDRMPFGEGAPQIVLGQMGIVWGFGGVP